MSYFPSGTTKPGFLAYNSSKQDSPGTVYNLQFDQSRNITNDGTNFTIPSNAFFMCDSRGDSDGSTQRFFYSYKPTNTLLTSLGAIEYAGSGGSIVSYTATAEINYVLNETAVDRSTAIQLNQLFDDPVLISQDNRIVGFRGV